MTDRRQGRPLARRLKTLDGGTWKSRISEPHRDRGSRWHGDDATRRAVYNNRERLRSGTARQAFKLRAERVKRGFALILDRGAMRRLWLRGRDNIQKRYLVHVAGYHLGLIVRLANRGGNAPGVPGIGRRLGFCDWGPRSGTDSRHLRRSRPSIRRLRTHSHTSLVRLKTHFLNGLLCRSRYAMGVGIIYNW